VQRSERGILFVYQVERLTYADSLKPEQVANSDPDLRCLGYSGKSQARSQAAFHIQLALCEVRTVQSSCLFAYRA